MTSSPVTWSRETARVDDHLRKRLYDHERFVRELEKWLGTTIVATCKPLAEAPPEGYVLLESVDPEESLRVCDEPRRANIAARVIAMSVSRSRILTNLLEPLSLAGAIDTLSLVEWDASAPEALGAWGVCGHIDVGERIGATPTRGIAATARYGYLVSPQHHGLPHLLADYLRALDGDAAVAR